MIKQFIFLLTLIILSQSAHSQSVPELINYQGLARDASGQPLVGQSITVSFTIWQGSPGGTNVFTETHYKTTNSFGLFDLKIGSINTSAFQAINWANGPYHLEVAVNGNSLGSQQMVSVPYALYAKSAGSVNLQAGNGISISGNTITNTSPGVTYTSGTNVTITSGSVINATPQLSINDNTLTITGGTPVVIPTLQAGTNVSITGGSIHATPSLALISNSLSISGGNTVLLPSAASTSFTSNGIATISPLSGNSFTITTPSPTFVNGQNINVSGTYPQYTIASTPYLALNGSSLSISGGNTVVLPASASTSFVSNGIATISPASGNSFTITTPSPTFVNGQNINVSGTYPQYTIASTPSLALISNSLSISGGNTIVLPSAASTTVSGIGNAIVTQPVTHSFVVNVPQQTLSIAGNGLSGSYSLQSTLGGTVSLPETTISINLPHSISSSPGGFSKSITVIPASLSITNGMGTSTLSISHGTTTVNSVTFSNGNLTGSFWSLNGNTITSANFLGSTNNFPVAFYANNNSVMRLFPSTSTAGILGLGDAAQPSFTPQSLAHFLIPNSTFTSALRLGHGNQPAAEWHFDVDLTSNMFLKNENIPSGPIITFSNNGFLGINEINPSHRLHVSHNGTNSGLFVQNAGNGNAISGIKTGGTSGNAGYFSSFSSINSSVLYINHNNPGIGLEINSSGNNDAFSINKSSNNGKGINLSMPSGSPMEGIHITHNGSGKAIYIDKPNIGDAIHILHSGFSGGNALNIQKNGNWGHGILVNGTTNDAVLFGSRPSGSGNVAYFSNASNSNTAPVVYAQNSNGSGDVIIADAQSLNSKNSLVLQNGHIKSTSALLPALTFTATNTFTSLITTVLLAATSTDVKGQVMATFTSTFAISSGEFIRFNISFTKPYSSQPIVVITPVDILFPEGIQYSVKNVTTSSFEIEVKNISNIGVSIGVNTIKINYFVIE